MASTASRKRHIFAGMVVLFAMFNAALADLLNFIQLARVMGLELSSFTGWALWPTINLALHFIAYVLMVVFMVSLCTKNAGNVAYAISFAIFLYFNVRELTGIIRTALTSSAVIQMTGLAFVLFETLILLIMMIDGFTGFRLRFLSIAAVILIMGVRIVRAINWLLSLSSYIKTQDMGAFITGLQHAAFILLGFGVLLFLIRYKRKQNYS